MSRKCVASLFVLSFLLMASLVPVVQASPAYEDFTDPSWIEVDPNEHINLVGTNHINFDAYSNEDAYLYNDKGIGYFGDFKHKIDAKSISTSANYAQGFVWMLANDVDDELGLRTPYGEKYFYVRFRRYDPNRQITLAYCDGTQVLVDVYTDFSYDTMYYFTIKREGTLLTCKIYSNSQRTNLLDTLTLSDVTTDTFRYIYASNTANYGTTPYMVLEIENLDLVEKYYVTFYNNTGGILRVDNATVTNGTQDVYPNGTVIELVAIVEGNLAYGFHNFTWDSNSNISNPYNLTVTSNLTVWCYFGEAVAVPTRGFSATWFILGATGGFIIFLAFGIVLRAREEEE